MEKFSTWLVEQKTNLPKKVFLGLDYEKSDKLSSKKRDVIIVRSDNRDSDRDDILRALKKQGIQAKLGSSSSSVDPVDGTYQNKDFRIMVKPGGGEKAGKPDATEFESVITVGINQANQKKISKKNAVDKKTFDNVAKYFPDYEKVALSLGKSFRKHFKGDAYQFGASRSKTSEMWKTRTAKGTDVPKTDIIVGKTNVSLKAEGGSQGASGLKKETVATMYAAMEMIGENPKYKKALTRIATDIEKGFGELLVKQTLTNFRGAIKKVDAEKSKTKKAAALAKTKLSKIPLDDFQKEADKLVKLDEFHKSHTELINKVIADDKEGNIRDAIVYISVTGYKKFADPKAIAHSLVEFDRKKGTLSSGYPINCGKDGNMSADLQKYSAACKFKASFKTASNKPQSALRITMNKLKSENKNFPKSFSEQNVNDVIIDELMKANGISYLPEEMIYLDEFKIISNLFKKGVDKVKEIGGNIKNWVMKTFKNILDRIKSIVSKIISLGKAALAKLFSFFGVEISSAKIQYPSELLDFAAK